MVVYLIPFAYLLLGAFLESFLIVTNETARKLFYWIIAIMLIAIAGLRYGLESDYWHYYNVFNGYEHPTSLEVGYIAIQEAIRLFTSDYNVFCLLIAIFSLGCKERVFSKNKYFFLLLFIYYMRFFVIFELNAIRQGIAMTFVLLAIMHYSKGDKKSFAAYTALGILVHTAAICVLLMPVAKYIKANLLQVACIYAVCLLFRFYLLDAVLGCFRIYTPVILSSSVNLLHGVQYIINSQDKMQAFSWLAIFRIIIPGLSLMALSEKTDNKFYFNIYFMGTVLSILLWGFDTIAFRIPAVFYLFEGYAIAEALDATPKKPGLLFLILIVLLCDCASLFSTMTNSASLIPYQSYLFAMN